MKKNAVAIIVKGYPRLSETFISQEIKGLESRGLNIELISLRRPTDPFTHPIHAEIKAPVKYLPEYIHYEPFRAFAGWFHAKKLDGFSAAYQIFLRDFARDKTRNRIRRFWQACILAKELRSSTRRIHAHFLHTPASVGRYASIMRGIPFSLSAHAVDIWTSPDWELEEKVNCAEWTAVCSQAGAAKLRSLGNRSSRIFMLYHGLDLERFRPEKSHFKKSDGTSSKSPVKLLSIGRTVHKKGFDVLLEALALLPADLYWEWTHIGDGPQTNNLKNHAKALGLSNFVCWRGAQNSEVVLMALREADLFVLPCRRDDDGNQDGLPNVLMEAQSQALAVVSTNISAIPEFIVDAKTGTLVPPDNPAILQKALFRLITSPDLRLQYGTAGQKRVKTHFNSKQNLDTLAKLLSDTSSAEDETCV